MPSKQLKTSTRKPGTQGPPDRDRPWRGWDGCRHGRETAWAPVAGGSARDQGDATAKVDANALLTGLCAAAHRPDENGERSVPIFRF